jgi:Cu+-exporting ATPase
MTCAACARIIERTLANTPGVGRANVNLATNTATVEFDPATAQVRDFVGAIEDLGYTVPEKEVRPDAVEQGYRRRLTVAATFAAPVLVLGMSHGALRPIPPVDSTGIPPGDSRRAFHAAAWSALRGAANMNS